ncbi:MAG TPA: CBS domain-containing protein [Polyangia bacterium]|nr:CBS domain-containing protein [Polyangia bacterium]
MSKNVLSVGPETLLFEARTRMKVGGVHHLLVKKDFKIVGILSERDTRRASASDIVSDVMTEHVVTVSPETTIRQAANLLRGRSIGCLPVLDGQDAVGIVTTTDLLELLGRGVEKPIERATRWTLRDRGARRASPAARHARRG